MNLEYDDEEQGLLSQFEHVIEDVGPLSQDQGTRGTGTWPRLVAAGWSELGREMETGTLPLGLAVGIFRGAGRQLLVEQFVSSAYLLSALTVHIPSDVSRQRAEQALKARPGVLLGDSRGSALPVVSGLTADGYCFGAEAGADAYSLTCSESGTYTLRRWRAAPPIVEFVPESALSTARVQCSRPAQWAGSRTRLISAHGTWIVFQLRLSCSIPLDSSDAREGCSDVTVEYVKTRHQFGVPIGSFQAVKHGLADVATAVAVSWNAILTASAVGADQAVAPLIARYLAVEAALLSARAGAQFHGGIGFTAELNVHYFLRTIIEGAQRFGSNDDFAAEIGRAIVARAC